MAEEVIAIDTNLLVYAHRSWLAESDLARRAIEGASMLSAGWGIPIQCVGEFWAVVTRKSDDNRPSRSEEAIDFLAALTSAGAKVFYPKPGFAQRLTTAACAANVSGRRIFDLQIALTALEAGARELWTHDRDFVTVAGLAIADPL